MGIGRSRQKIGRLLLVTLVATGIVGTVGTTPANAASAIGILQFNMCGNVCTNDSIPTADAVVSSITNHSPQPAFVMLEEVCRDQYNEIWNLLPTYDGYFIKTVTGGCSGGSMDYGIAILTKTFSWTQLGPWKLPEQVGYTSDEDRYLGCLQTSTFGGSQPIVACVTHISTNSHNQPGQVQFVASKGSYYYNGHKVIVGGDFNLTPPVQSMNPMYDSAYSPTGSGIFNEADADPSTLSRTGGGAGSTYNEYTVCGGNRKPCGYGKTYSPTSKIDYIFASDFDFTSRSADATYSTVSDHTPLWGLVTPT